MTRRPLRIALIVIASAIVVVLVAVVVMSQVYLHRPFPQQDGTVALSGLDGEVKVVRDAHGVPQIYAGTSADLFRALGYVHAQDRFFEMDVRRHVAAGRLSELVGRNTDALTSDMVVRTLGWRQVAEQEMSLLSASTRAALEAYSAGVNDYLRGRSPSQISVNYTILGVEHTLGRIEPWTPVDCLTWLKALDWNLKTNYDDELARARIYASVKDTKRVAQLFPPYPYDRHAPILSNAAPATTGAAATSGANATTGANATSGAASNNAGSRPLGSAAPLSSAAPAGRRPGRAAASAQGAATAVLAGFVSHDLRQASAEQAFDDAASALGSLSGLLGTPGGDIGSNSWVVSGRYTAGGKPLLAADPHFTASIPGTWYQVGLHCRAVGPACPYDVSGVTMSGVPAVFSGHNGQIAWGLTAMYADVTDFYLERTTALGTYQRDGQLEPIQTRQETIKIADADPVTVTVRSTMHGPLLSDVSAAAKLAGQGAPVPALSPPRGHAYAVALAWTALTPGRSMDALLGIDAAAGIDQFRAAAANLAAPALNLVYADVAGHIGYTAAGMIPLRPRAPIGSPVPTDGSWPLPGWSSRYDWTGYLPADALPSAGEPADGMIVAANQAVLPKASGPWFTADWDYGYRSQRIHDLLAAATRSGRKLTVADIESIQADTRNEIAPDLVPILLKTKVDAFTQQALNLLKAWGPGYSQPADSAAAAYFNAVWATMLDLTFSDELPDGTRPTGGGRWFEVIRELLKHPQDPWWDDRRTPSVVETRDEIIRQSLVQARLRLTSELGKDPERWQWGRLHRLRLRQTPLGGTDSAELIQDLVNRGPFDAPGGTAAVDAMAWDATAGEFDVTSGPSFRMIVDLGHLDASRWVNETGNSGHPGSGQYDDQIDAWLSGQTYPWAYSQAAVEAARKHELVLTPAG